MSRREDYYSHTEEDAGHWEAAHAEPDDDIPTLAEIEREEAEEGWGDW